MSDQELFQAIRSIVREEIEPIKKDITGMKADITGLKADVAEMKADIADLKEGQEEIRNCVNAILDWSDKVSDAIKFPLPRI